VPINNDGEPAEEVIILTKGQAWPDNRCLREYLSNGRFFFSLRLVPDRRRCRAGAKSRYLGSGALYCGPAPLTRAAVGKSTKINITGGAPFVVIGTERKVGGVRRRDRRILPIRSSATAPKHVGQSAG
jgi:hypothetical protein